MRPVERMSIDPSVKNMRSKSASTIMPLAGIFACASWLNRYALTPKVNAATNRLVTTIVTRRARPFSIATRRPLRNSRTRSRRNTPA
jgi:hypothetical protein